MVCGAQALGEKRCAARRGGKKPGTRTCNCKMDQEARAGIVGTSVLPAAAAYNHRDPSSHSASLPTFLWLQIASRAYREHYHSPAQSVNSGDGLIAAVEQIFVCDVASVVDSWRKWKIPRFLDTV